MGKQQNIRAFSHTLAKQEPDLVPAPGAIFLNVVIHTTSSVENLQTRYQETGNAVWDLRF
ncbi:hypothetical protein J6590_107743, partial [Homalodisca vitripennis]